MGTQEFNADIIIAGAGPSGLVIACEPALGGTRVLVLEKRNGPTWSRTGTLAPRMEIFESRGIADRFVTRALQLHHHPHASEGIWAGFRPIRYEAIDSGDQSVMMFAQLETEKPLANRLMEFGREIRLNSDVTGFRQDEEGVCYCDGDEQDVTGLYLVGADGNRSPVREGAGIARHGVPASRVAVNIEREDRQPVRGCAHCRGQREWLGHLLDAQRLSVDNETALPRRRCGPGDVRPDRGILT